MKKFLFLVILTTFSFILFAQDENVYVSDTWNSDRTINGNLIIWNGATLTISPGVTIDFNGSPINKLIIKANASLVANEVLFTSTSGIWYGITMEGLGSQYPQSGTPAQPKAVLSYCQINNCQVGISNYHLNPLTYTGGWISLAHCEITNYTLAGVWFSNYRFMDPNGNLVNDKSRIVKSFFRTNAVGANGIYMDRVNNIQILGNQFGKYFPSYPSYQFTGIRIVLSSAIIKPFGVTRNTFYECWKGIYISNGYNPAYKVVIENNLFDNTWDNVEEWVAIQAIAANNLSILSNEINLKQYCSIPCTAPLQFGIHLNGCTGFHVENNYITVKPNKGSLHNTYGIVVVNSNGQSNEIYRNTIDGCHYAIQALNKNRGLAYPNQPNDDGLRFFCNTLGVNKEGDYFALSAEVVSTGLTDPTYGVAKMQGGSMIGIPTSPAFNVIDRPDPLPVGSERDFFNNHQAPNSYNLTDVVYMEPKYQPGIPWYYIEYYTGNQNNFGIPNHVSPISHPLITADPDVWPRCESRLPGVFPGINEIVDNIQNTYNDLQIARSTFMGYANDGDHNYMLTVANNIDSTNYIFAYLDFMTKHPSHDILAIMAANESMPASYIADILLQNTYGIKDGHVRDALANRTDQLSQASIDTIFQASGNLSQYETYKMEVSYLSNELRKHKNLLYDYHHSVDTTLVNINGIVAYLDSDDDFQSKYALLMFYYENQDQANVNTYKTIVEQATADTYETNDALALFDLLDIIHFNYNGDYSMLSQGEINFLLDLSQMTSVSASIALYILEAHLGFAFPLLASDLSNSTPRMGKFPDEPDISELSIHPNPASSYITVVIPEGLEQSTMVVMDLTGRTIISNSITSANSTHDIHQLVNGVYIVRVYSNNKLIGTHKLIINR